MDDDLDDWVRRWREAANSCTKEQLDKFLNDNNPAVRQEVAQHPNATIEHLDKALSDIRIAVRIAAARNPNATKEQLDRALNDDHRYVRQAASRNPNADPVSVAYFKMKYIT